MPSGADAGTPRIDCHDVRPYRMRGSELSSASSPTSRCAPEDHEAELKARRAADNRGRPGAHRLRRQNLLSNALKFTRPEVNRWSSAARSASSLAAASRSRACPEWGPHSRWHGESVSLKGASGRENASSDHHPPRRRRPRGSRAHQGGASRACLAHDIRFVDDLRPRHARFVRESSPSRCPPRRGPRRQATGRACSGRVDTVRPACASRSPERA